LSQGRTLRDRVLLDSLKYGASDLVKTSVLLVDELVLNLVKTGKVSCLERLAMAGYEHINVVDRHGKSKMAAAAILNNSAITRSLLHASAQFSTQGLKITSRIRAFTVKFHFCQNPRWRQQPF